MSCCDDTIVQLVQGDTRPTLELFLYDATTGLPFDVSQSGTDVLFLLKPSSPKADVKEVLTCQKLPGTVGDDGEVTYPPAYSVPGSGGRVEVHWTTTALDTSGQFVGKAEVNWNDGTRQTMIDNITLQIQAAWNGP